MRCRNRSEILCIVHNSLFHSLTHIHSFIYSFIHALTPSTHAGREGRQGRRPLRGRGVCVRVRGVCVCVCEFTFCFSRLLVRALLFFLPILFVSLVFSLLFLLLLSCRLVNSLSHLFYFISLFHLTHSLSLTHSLWLSHPLPLLCCVVSLLSSSHSFTLTLTHSLTHSL